MLIYKATKTLDGYLPSLEYTEDKTRAEIILVGGKKFVLDDFPQLRNVGSIAKYVKQKLNGGN